MSWLQVNVKGCINKAILLGTIYRPPQANIEYYEKILDVLDTISTEGLDIVLAGDLNLNYLDENMKKKIVSIESLYNMKQLVTKPTREVFIHNKETKKLEITSSLIDIVLSTCPGNHTYTHVKTCTISDHSLIKTQICFQALHKHRTITFRNFSKFDSNKFKEDLNSALENGKENIFDNQCTQSAWNHFKMCFTKISNQHAPLRTSRMKSRNNPWINSDIVKEMYKRDYFKQVALKLKTDQALNEYRRQRNKVNSLVKQAKQVYFTNIAVNDSTNIWSILHQVLPNKYNNQKQTSITADEFANHFSKVGSAISDTFEEDSKAETTIKGVQSIYNFQLEMVNNKDVLKLLDDLPSKSSNDVLGMDSKLLKVARNEISNILTHIINLSIKYSEVVPDWKIARVSPVYKGKGSLEDKAAYRPIANVGHIGKIVEKVINKQLTNYLYIHKFISYEQSAYLKGHSTQTALHRITEDWLDSINNGEVTMACFLDVKKCYDTIDHTILTKKLKQYGISNSELNWFQSYLENRNIVVQYQDKKSHITGVNIGLPQGSALGPTLFNIFINDLSQSVSPGQLNMFADDSLIYVSGQNIHEIQHKLQSAINNAAKWYNRNHLALNEDKTQVMIIHGHLKEPDIPDPIRINNIAIPFVSSTRYLGVILDSRLDFKIHTEHVVSNTRSKLSALRRLSKFLSNQCLTLIYKTKIEPAMEYANTIWLHSSDNNKKLIQRQQNTAARIIKNNFDYENVRSSQLIKELQWLTCEQRLNYQTCLIMYKAVNGMAPTYINDLILFNFETHSYQTRNINSMSLYTPNVYKEQFRNSLQYIGAKLWNGLPDYVHKANNIDNFKSFYFRHLRSTFNVAF